MVLLYDEIKEILNQTHPSVFLSYEGYLLLSSLLHQKDDDIPLTKKILKKAIELSDGSKPLSQVEIILAVSTEPDFAEYLPLPPLLPQIEPSISEEREDELRRLLPNRYLERALLDVMENAINFVVAVCLPLEKDDQRRVLDAIPIPLIGDSYEKQLKNKLTTIIIQRLIEITPFHCHLLLPNLPEAEFIQTVYYSQIVEAIENNPYFDFSGFLA